MRLNPKQIQRLFLVLAAEAISENVAFAEKLQRLERLGALESIERWRQLREITHEYEDAPALKAAVLNRFIDEMASLLFIFWRSPEPGVLNQSLR